jgi:hypothetical protein
MDYPQHITPIRLAPRGRFPKHSKDPGVRLRTRAEALEYVQCKLAEWQRKHQKGEGDGDQL